jgi:hypothetical protein
MKKFIAFSGGVESTTMSLMFGHDAQPIFADTGFEHEETWRMREYIGILWGTFAVWFGWVTRGAVHEAKRAYLLKMLLYRARRMK